MNRRDFIKHTIGAAVATSAVLTACRTKEKNVAKKRLYQDTDKQTTDGMMTMRLNPNSGDKVSLLGYGMMRLPVKAGGTARENPDAPIDQEAVNELVDYALAHGVNYFDTSPVYCQGMSEQSTGIALSRHPRKSYYIATKMSNFDQATWSEQESKAMFERSLEYLKTDYIDYLLLHSIGGASRGKSSLETFNGRYMDNGILDWLVEQKQIGRIRNLGFSYHGDISIFDMLLRWHDEGRYHWDFCQIELNYLDWSYAKEINPRNTNASYLYAELHKRGIPAVIMEPLLGGRLAHQPEHITRLFLERDPQSTAAEWALRYAGTPEGVMTVLSGMTYMEHVVENIHTYSPLIPLTEEENRFMLSIAEKVFSLKAIPCTTCNYCMPCPYGLNIPMIFAHYNNCIAEGNVPSLIDNPDSKAFRQQRRAFLVGYDRKVPKLRQADHCIGCHHCEPHCPQRIDIPSEMEKIRQYVETLKIL